MKCLSCFTSLGYEFNLIPDQKSFASDGTVTFNITSDKPPAGVFVSQELGVLHHGSVNRVCALMGLRSFSSIANCNPTWIQPQPTSRLSSLLVRLSYTITTPYSFDASIQTNQLFTWHSPLDLGWGVSTDVARKIGDSSILVLAADKFLAIQTITIAVFDNYGNPTVPYPQSHILYDG